MNGWKEGWMNEWKDEWMNEWSNQWENKCTCRMIISDLTNGSSLIRSLKF